LEKNRDTLRQELQDLMATSGSAFLADLFKTQPDGGLKEGAMNSKGTISAGTTKKSTKALTTGAQFHVSLGSIFLYNSSNTQLIRTP
jgi:myosin heavy subunit